MIPTIPTLYHLSLPVGTIIFLKASNGSRNDRYKESQTSQSFHTSFTSTSIFYLILGSFYSSFSSSTFNLIIIVSVCSCIPPLPQFTPVPTSFLPVLFSNMSAEHALFHFHIDNLFRSFSFYILVSQIMLECGVFCHYMSCLHC